MCEPVTTGLIIQGIGAATAVGSTLHAANTRVKPQKPQMQAEVKQPRVDNPRNRNRSGPAYGVGNLLTSGGNTAAATLLGQ